MPDVPINAGEGVRALAAALQQAVGGREPAWSNDNEMYAFGGESVASSAFGEQGHTEEPSPGAQQAAATSATDSVHVEDMEEEEVEEDEEPPLLDPNDPHGWLFELSEEELLMLEISDKD